MTTTDGLTVDGAGNLLAGRYRLESRVGAGGTGVVWLARDERLDRQVAVKQLWPGPAQSEQARQRILREGRNAARLRHPNVVTVHDVAEHNGQPVLVMEYLPSRSLAEVVAEQGLLTPEAVARIGLQAAAALAAAHAAGIVHRDVKPGNLLVADDGTVKIADFGISRATGDSALTQGGLVSGTPMFLAPEIARGEEPTPDSDVFSLGATLYDAVEGAPPFGDDENPIALLHRVAAGEVPEPEYAGPLAPVLMAMLRPDPAQRPSTVQVVTALQAVADGQPVPPRTLNPARARTQPVVTPASPTVPVAPVAGSSGAGTRLDAPVAGPGGAGTRVNAPAAAGTRLDIPVAEPVGAATRLNTPVAGAGGAGTRLNKRVAGLVASKRRFLLPVAGAVLAVLAVVILFTQLTPDPPAPAPAPPPAALDAAAITGAVREYYALLPARPDNAWTRLGPKMQAQGQDAYRARWAGITALTVTTPPAVVADNTVSVTIAYTFEDGRVVTETHQLGLIPAAPAPLIDSDAVLTSETSTPPPPPPSPTPATAAEPPPGGDTGDRNDRDDRDDHKPGRGHGRDRD
ncbi:serine/threonine-protein kinase [Amycolatopsis thermoflava]|uniref:serine/threonine-protein kinase n=1 Tax=Amycolatopsis thermoflava TaxID=84480 RepID=UPI000F4B86C7|nr:serine/threonine-protein kinase [Amycolatopsis thermoflava]